MNRILMIFVSTKSENKVLVTVFWAKHCFLLPKHEKTFFKEHAFIPDCCGSVG